MQNVNNIVVTISSRDVRRCITERTILTVKPFAAGYSAGCYVEHISQEEQMKIKAEQDAEWDMGEC